MAVSASDLDRFVTAQSRDYARALAELRAGRKQSHWMWYVLPQLRGLGHSHMAHTYGVAGREEAAAYLAHPILGPRLLECVQAVLQHTDLSAEEIFGGIDATKFRSCLTLFAAVAPDERCFQEALSRFYEGQPDDMTLALLRTRAQSGTGP